jgi:nucleotide-binding universal stress UspA family protein
MQTKLPPILLCVDLEADSEVLSKYAAKYAMQCRQSLHVIHIIPQASRQTNEEAHQRLKTLIDNTFDRIKVEAIVLRRGVPEDEILSYAKSHSCDPVMLGHRHRSTVERIYVGSTTKTVLSLSPRPILVVPIDSVKKKQEVISTT